MESRKSVTMNFGQKVTNTPPDEGEEQAKNRFGLQHRLNNNIIKSMDSSYLKNTILCPQQWSCIFQNILFKSGVVFPYSKRRQSLVYGLLAVIFYSPA